jgi:hypothetical protein
VRTIFFCTEPFESMARMEAMGLGLPELPVVVVPHPLMTRSEAELTKMAIALLPQVVAKALRGDSDT